MSTPNYSTDPNIDPDVYQHVKEQALTLLFDNAETISVRLLLETTRAELKRKINSNTAPAIARRLLAEYPDFDGVIEIRETKRGKNKPKSTDLDVIADYLASHKSLTATSITVVVNATGVTRTFDITRFSEILRNTKGSRN